MGVGEAFRSTDICIYYIFHSIWMRFALRCSQHAIWKHNVSFTDNFICFFWIQKKVWRLSCIYALFNKPAILPKWPISSCNVQKIYSFGVKYIITWLISMPTTKSGIAIASNGYQKWLYHGPLGCKWWSRGYKLHIIDAQFLECCPRLTVVNFFFWKLHIFLE